MSDIPAQPCLRGANLRLPGCRLERIEGLEWKFGIDHKAKLGIGQPDQAVGPRAIGKRRLERKGPGVQAITNDRFHTSLAIGATSLYVGEDVLERDHLGGEL